MRGPRPSTRDAVFALAAQATPTIPLRRRLVGVLLLGLVVLPVSVAVHPRPELAHGSPWLMGSTALLVVASLLAAVLSLATRSATGPSVARLGLVATLTVPWFAGVVAIAPVGAASAHPTLGLGCFLTLSALGGAISAALVAAFRHGVPVRPALRGAAFAVVGAAWAGLALHLRCPSGDRLHLLVGHVLPMIVLAVFGAWVGRRALAP